MESCLSSFQCTLNPETSEPTDNLTEQAVEFCQRVGSRATTVSQIVGQRDEAVYQAIHEGIQRVNANAAARPYHIQKWAILERDFSISGGELGRSFFSPFLGLYGRAKPMAVAGWSPLGSSHASGGSDRPLDSICAGCSDSIQPESSHFIIGSVGCNHRWMRNAKRENCIHPEHIRLGFPPPSFK